MLKPSLFVILCCTMFITMPHASAQPDTGVFNFKQNVTDSSGNEYFIGEIQNTDQKNNIESMIYFGDSLANASYYQDIGTVGHGMAIPFKINMSKVPDGKQLDLSDMKEASFVTLDQPADFLRVDYKSLHLNRSSGAISGIINNTSQLDVSNVTVLAIAESPHAKVLDVVQSKVIDKIPPHGSAHFTLTPVDSVSSEVGYYSCFVAGQLEQNYTFTDETGKTVLFELGGDGIFKGVYYNSTDHSLNFDARGVFPNGGYAELMFLSEPASLENVPSLTATINGTNYSTSISSHEMIGGKAYPHISVLYPFGLNSISIRGVEQTPEYPYPAIVTVAAMLSVIAFSKLKPTIKF